jgi:hypothetical protein
MLPTSIARTYALAEVNGNTKVTDSLTKVLDKFPTTGEIDMKKWSMDFQKDMQKFGFEMTRFKQEHDLNIFNAMREGLGSQFEEGMKILDRKDATPAEQNAGKAMIADAIAKKGMVSVKSPGGNFTIGTQDMATRVKDWQNLTLPWNRINELTINNPADLSRAMQPPPTATPEEQKAWKKELGLRLNELGLLNTEPSEGDASAVGAASIGAR